MGERRWFWLFCVPLVVTIAGGIIVNRLSGGPDDPTPPTIVSDPNAPVTFSCNETYYDKTGNNPYPVPRYFTYYPRSKFVWDNHKRDNPLPLRIIHETPAILVAEAESSERMPRPDQIDACIKKEIASRPELMDEAGVNPFSVLGCSTAADETTHETPVQLRVTINRVTGSLSIKRSPGSAGTYQVSSGGSAYETEHYGECVIAEKRL